MRPNAGVQPRRVSKANEDNLSARGVRCGSNLNSSNSLSVKERCSCASDGGCKCGHMELLVHSGGKDDQHDTSNHGDERKRDNRKLNKTKRAAEDKQPADDGENAEGVPTDWTAEQSWPPREHDVAKRLVTDADKRDECRTT